MKAFDFFFAHAGYSYTPGKESEFAGRVRCALELARAEARSFAEGLRFEWSIDPDIDSSDFSDDPEPWELWALTVSDEDGNVLASLGGIDFGHSDPGSDPYGRVVEAELALEALDLE